MYNELTGQVYGLWDKAVHSSDSSAKREIDRLLEQNLARFISMDYPKEMYRARIVYPNDFREIVLSEREDLFRGRSGINGFPADQMGAPPKNSASNGRANKEQETVLYLSSDIQTACAEVQPTCSAFISVAIFSICDGLSVVDLRSIPGDLQSFTQDDTAEKLIDLVFCESIVEFFSIPVSNKESELYDYSQYIAKVFQSKQIAGVIYRSSHNFNSTAFNLALFNPQNAHCGCTCGDMYRCLSRSASFQNISRNYTNKNLEIIETSRQIEPILWNQTLLLSKEIEECRR